VNGTPAPCTSSGPRLNYLAGNANRPIVARVNRELPLSAACERNKAPILDVLRVELASARDVLEIGSGTGQHAVFFAASLPHLVWHTSDRVENHESIRAWIDAEGTDNVRPPLALDVAHAWPDRRFDAVFSANTAHIMSWPDVCAMFAGVGRVLAVGGCFLLYGPFSYDGRHTSASNADFDRMLRGRDPASGIRDAAAIDREAVAAGMHRTADYAMPANNRILAWRKTR
jgi:cyclopropane fatty-acyl-phospholipid synthase-like methyltransferase